MAEEGHGRARGDSLGPRKDLQRDRVADDADHLGQGFTPVFALDYRQILEADNGVLTLRRFRHLHLQDIADDRQNFGIMNEFLCHSQTVPLNASVLRFGPSQAFVQNRAISSDLLGHAESNVMNRCWPLSNRAYFSAKSP